MERKYVTVIAEVRPDGDLYPKTLRFEDGSEFKIDRRLQTPRRHPAKHGTSDSQFYCRFKGRVVTLFYNADTHRWWIGRDA